MELVPGNYYISHLMKDVSLIIETQAEQKGLAFKVTIDEQLPTQLFGDKVHLRGIIINILNNAVKYTEKGCISFQTRVKEKEGKRILLEFEINDTGIGIRKEDIPNLFKKFERLDISNTYHIEGSGLGLSIANGYVKLMNGEIKVNSIYGQGTTFPITVPQEIVDDTPFNKNYVYTPKTEAVSGKFRIDSVEILVVDDNRVNLRMAQGLFGSYGFRVYVADSGKKAIDICSKECYPLVFMDQMIPYIDGVMAMKELRKINPYYAPGGEGKIIVLTADAIMGVREKLLKQGFDEYIGKPFDNNNNGTEPSSPPSSDDNMDDFDCLDSDTITILLKSIQGYIDRFEFDHIFEILEVLEDCVLKPSDKELFDSIRNAMKNLDVDTVKMIINDNFH